ncbi:MAG TPA: glutamate--tRNA ligase [Bacteroidales bacterium]|nr:glutamate--tRNA ligase [Bacteroidales bacterium]
MKNKVRVRFAPSPTGPLHIGGVRTALYNYLFAKRHNGDMILRIEDTDQLRLVHGAEEYIIESLRWCGIAYNEGVGAGGPHAPYRQSERKNIYKQYAQHLIDNGFAYYAFDSAEELDKLRKSHEAEKKTFQYDQKNRIHLNNSLTLSESRTKELIESGAPYAIRLKIPENEQIIIKDLIRGEVIFDSSLLDDKVIFKSDGLPTYHLANVVDDHLMEISHVIRGEEWLPSAPLHVLLYRYLGWESEMPLFAHLPLLLKPDGNGKLSKRDSDRLGFPVFPLRWTDSKTGEISSGYRESGYLPEAVVNMLALLGWNPGTEQEVFSMDELIATFSLERVGKSGSKFSPEKAKWFNHQYLQTKTNEELALLFLPELKAKNIDAALSHVARICSLVKERINFIHELWTQSYYFFSAPAEYDAKSVKDRWKADSAEKMKEITCVIKECDSWNASAIKQQLMNHITEKQYNTGQIMNALRVIIVGAAMGTDMGIILEMIGKEETLRRIETGIRRLG